jgi:hypothetical protein
MKTTAVKSSIKIKTVKIELAEKRKSSQKTRCTTTITKSKLSLVTCVNVLVNDHKLNRLKVPTIAKMCN